MSIEVAAQQFLFSPDSEPDLTKLDRVAMITGQKDKKACEDVPFFPNHLHDLESLWWVAVWIVFYTDISEGASSHDHTSTALRASLELAENLFPSTPANTTRHIGFQVSTSFKGLCSRLPVNKEAICEYLDILRQMLIKHYRRVEQNIPQIEPSSSSDEIYDVFIKAFSNLETATQGFALKLIRDIQCELLMAEKEEQKQKRARPQSLDEKAAERAFKK